MELGLPNRIAEAGAEHQVEKINNTCRLTVLGLVKKALEDEYNEVLRDPVFGPILAINEHELGYSGKFIHSFICKMLDISKHHELWFLFARKPLRFSMQEFHAVTGLKCEADEDTDFEDWTDDEGFWGTFLRTDKAVDMKTIRLKHLHNCNDWSRVDMVRLVYLCVICFVMAKDEKIDIPHAYIRLVMDFDKMRKYLLRTDVYYEEYPPNRPLLISTARRVKPISYY